MSLAISSDGSRILSGSRDRTMRLWNGQTPFEELGVCEHEDQVKSVAFSPDNSLIASGSDDCTVRIWNARSLDEVTRLAGHRNIVTCVTFFPDGTRIASASWDCTVRLWNTRTYESLPGLQFSGPVWAIALSPDGTRLALAEHTSTTEGNLRVYDIVTLTEQAQVNISPGAYLPWALAFSPRGDLIGSGAASGSIQVWGTSNLSNIAKMTGHHGQVTSIAFSSDGSQIVSGSWDGTVRIRPIASSAVEFINSPGIRSIGGSQSHSVVRRVFSQWHPAGRDVKRQDGPCVGYGQLYSGGRTRSSSPKHRLALCYFLSRRQGHSDAPLGQWSFVDLR
jgi:WD40 repeat protein